MAKCDSCGTTIVFGGVRDGNLRFCNEKCHREGQHLTIAGQFPDEAVLEYTFEIHEGACPQCGGDGPVDVHTSHTIWSLLYFTSWKSNPQVCCRSCGTRARIKGIALSGLFGWWGFPWGLLGTPVQILRNAAGLFASSKPGQPSAELMEFARTNLAQQFLAARAEQEAREAAERAERFDPEDP